MSNQHTFIYMKPILVTCFIIGMCFLAKAQLAISDYMNCYIENPYPMPLAQQTTSSCNATSQDFSLKYGNQTYYIPNTTNPVIKTVLVNFNIMQKDDGSGNFTENDLIDLNQMFTWMSDIYQYNDQPSDPIPGVQYIPDTYIRFELGEIYFYKNSSLFNSNSSGNLLNYLKSNFPSRLNQLNIFFTEYNAPGASGFTNSLPSKYDFNLDQCIVTFKKHSTGPVGYWACAGHLSHEIGHVLGLLHMYEPSCCHETCDENDPDYLDDIFGRDGINTNCWQDGGWGCDPFAQGSTCTNNIMSGTQQSGYFSPKQMGRIHRSLTTYSTRRYVKCPSSLANELLINNNEYWDFSMQVYQDIVVKTGNSLTVNCSLYMPSSSRIIVEAGAKLILNGATLANSCTNAKWQGIEVWGNKNANQLPDANGNYQQGYLELNNATIENAVCAVDLWKPEDYSKTGGILKATNSIFRNNAKSIHALHYRNTHPYHPEWEMNYNGSVKNCTFEITTDYIPANTFYKHVDLANIRGFSFSGSDFTLSPNVAGVSDWNQGIAAYSAGFSVQATCTSATQPCSSYDKCKFNGFRYGIFVNDALFSTNTFTVNRAEFENNIYGINVLDIKNETILNSDFEVGYNSTPGCPAVSGYGIYLDNSTGFAIEENTFTKMPNAPVANYTGIHVNNSQGVNDIYKNSFSNLSFGNSAYWTNWAGSTLTGLEYLCNINQSNWADFYVPLNQKNENNIQSFQGSYLLSAGNIFSQTDNTWHFYNGGGSGVTYHYIGSSPLEPIQTKLFNVAKSTSNVSNQCPSHYGGNGTVSSIVLNAQDKLLRENQYAYNLVNYNNVKTLHDQLRDGGSTQERVSDIETAQPQDMWALRAELLGVSPHLSEEVLRKVADKIDVFTESVIFDILAANPDELKNEELLQYLENKENPLHSYMIDILRQVAAGETYRTVLEKQMSMYRKEMTRAANDMIRSYLNDSVTDYIALRGWLDNLGGIEADKQIIATYVQEGNYQQASALANMLPTLYNLTGNALTEHGRYMTMLNLYQTLQTENRHLDQLTTNEKALLEDYANNSSGSSGVAAKGILATYYNDQFVDCMQSIEPASLKKGTVSPEDMAKVYGMEISVKPNPASDWAAFDYILPDLDVTATLQITDMTGKIIETFTLTGKHGQKLWDTRPVKSGVYLYTMKSGIKSLTGKITIIK
ncbi:MAG: T9SS type A sorting domain-containing protein [Lentimicrobiaceae bacterium]